jgi:hypothetical protein
MISDTVSAGMKRHRVKKIGCPEWLVVAAMSVCAASCSTLTVRPRPSEPVTVVGYLYAVGEVMVTAWHVERSDIQVDESSRCMSVKLSSDFKPLPVVREYTGLPVRLYGRFVRYQDFVADKPFGGMLHSLQNSCGNEHILLVNGIEPA